MHRPDPFREIRPVLLRSLPGPNFWSRSPVTRLDLVIGAYDEISSADVAGFTDALADAFPGLVEHRCSVGERGGFLVRLRRGTYAAHITEHLALELQTRIGHRVGFGRARGGERPGEYSVVLAHRHAGVGRRAAELALAFVQRAFADQPLRVEEALAELRALAATPDDFPPHRRVLCGITGAGPREAMRELLLPACGGDAELVDLPPLQLLEHGLPYDRSRLAVVLGSDLDDVPERFRDPAAAAQLLSVVADAVEPGGFVVVAAAEREVQERVRAAGCSLALFGEAGRAPHAPRAEAAAWVRSGRIVVEHRGERRDLGPLRPGPDADARLAAALCRYLLIETTDPGNPRPEE
jgi:hypothetical protein